MYLCYTVVKSIVHASTLPLMAPLLLEEEKIAGQLKQRTEQIWHGKWVLLFNFRNNSEGEGLNGEYCFTSRI